jgi:hypothetical protein
VECYARVYRTEGEVILAACDRDLWGKTFEEGKRILEVRKEFYGEELLDGNEFACLLREATIANLVGEEVVSHSQALGYVDPEAVLRIQGVPHAHIYQL